MESPGDVGVPPTLKWELPRDNFQKKISYAPPQLVKMLQVFTLVIVMKPFFYTFDVDRKL